MQIGNGTVQFDSFEVDPRSEELRKQGLRLRIPRQSFQILVLLLQCPGEFVRREELRERLWPADTFVDFDHGLNAAVNRLRQALGDSVGEPRFIETRPRLGYRFIAPLKFRSADITALGALDSVAVLPLVNATGDPETEYLSDGISESVINLLSQFPNLKVIPRTSAFRYKGRDSDLKTIGSDLRVRTVLTGKMIQCNDRLVVQTELVDVVNDAQLWGGRFNRKLDDIFEVQEELARQISENLRLRLTRENEKCLARRPTQNREAYQFLLKAKYHANKGAPDGVQRGITYAKQAIEADPLYSEAYAWMSFLYTALGSLGSLPPAEAFPRAKAAALKALEIDELLPEAHHVLGMVRLFYEWDWSGSEAAARRALDLNPNYSWGHSLLSQWLLIMGRHEEAVTEAQLAAELDPLWVNLTANLGQVFYAIRSYDCALEQLQKALELDSNFVWAHTLLAQVYALKGMHAESFAAWEKAASLFSNDPLRGAFRSMILAMTGRTDEAKTALNDLRKQPKLPPLALVPLAITCGVLGEKDEAFEFLERAYRERVGSLIFLGVRPTFDKLRSDPRFTDLSNRMGLRPTPIPNSCAS